MLFEELVQSPKLFSKNKIVTIMFDDGYFDNYEYAIPILEKYNCKAFFCTVTFLKIYRLRSGKSKKLCEVNRCFRSGQQNTLSIYIKTNYSDPPRRTAKPSIKHLD
jgi:hypothetical protein